MRTTAIVTIAVLLGIILSAPSVARAEVATEQEMELVCLNWLAYTVHQDGTWAGEREPRIVGFQDLVQGDTVLARCFSIAPRGCAS